MTWRSAESIDRYGVHAVPAGPSYEAPTVGDQTRVLHYSKDREPAVTSFLAPGGFKNDYPVVVWAQ
jgi:hypothetical protein